MLRVAVGTLRGYWVRFLLTAMAVVLGVSFISGVYVLTDSLKAAFTDLIGANYAHVDVVVRGSEGARGPGGQLRGQFPLAETTAKLQQVPNVKRVSPALEGSAVLVNGDGTAVRRGMAPTLGLAYEPQDPSVRLVNGRAPSGEQEVVVEDRTLSGSDLAVGRQATVLVRDKILQVTIVGTVAVEVNPGATLVFWDLPAASALLAPSGTVGTFQVQGDGSVDQKTLRDRVAQVMPGADVSTGRDAYRKAADRLNEDFGFVNKFLLVFAAVALVVGTFLIVNTFNMLLAQRTKELAMLRAIGASRGQLLRMVLGEAFVVGVIGAAIGLPVGIGVARGVQQVLQWFGVDFGGRLPVEPRTVAVSLTVGVLVTFLAALFPALRATAVAPVAAMRDDLTPTQRDLSVRVLLASVFLLAAISGMALTFNTVDDRQNLSLGLTAGAAFLCFVFASAPLVRPVIGLIGLPLSRTRTVVPRLARGNTLRNPRRTAITAAALMVGLALVSAVSVMSESATASTRSVMSTSITSDLVLSAGTSEYPNGINSQVAQVPGVESVTSMSGVPVRIEADRFFAMGVNSGPLSRSFRMEFSDGEAGALDSGKILVPRSLADKYGWSVGRSVDAVVGVMPGLKLEVGGVFERNAALGETIVLPQELADKAVPVQYRREFLGLVNLAPQADRAQVTAAIKEKVRPYLVISVLTNEEFAETQVRQIQQLLAVVYGLLLLSVLIAVLGIVNTLAMSVYERTREIGLLRAVGLAKHQLWSMVTVESVLTALFGAALGVVLGVPLGALVIHTQADQGLNVLSIPWAAIGWLFAGSALIGVIAALLPAFWATRLNVLDAIASE